VPEPLIRAVMIIVAALILWTLVRALRSGRIAGRGVSFALEDNPLLFSVALAFNAGALVFCLWRATGRDLASLWHVLLGGL
jgi:hypothetical protein